MGAPSIFCFSNRRLITASLVALVTIAACSGDKTTGPPTGPTEPEPVASVQVTPSAPTLTALGATEQLGAVAKDASGNTIPGKSFTWSSTDEAVATVDSSGLATAVDNGAAAISATTDGVSGNASVTVAQQVASVDVNSAADTLNSVADTTLLTATPKDANGNAVTGKTTTWSSTDASVATVDANGLVTAIANGRVHITATVDAIEGSIALVVNQIAVELVITTQPDGAAAGRALITQPVLELQDAGGSLVVGDSTTSITAAVASGGGTVDGTVTAAAVGGIVTYTDLTVRGTAGERTLNFAALGVSPVTSASFTLAPGSPSHLTITTQPDGAAAGLALTTQPALEVRDLDGNLVDSDNATEVTATIASGGGVIQGGDKVIAVAGVVTYADLGIGGTVGDRTVAFTATGLASATSDAFTVTPGRAAQVSLTGGHDQTALAATTLGIPLSVTVVDAFDNYVEGVAVAWDVTAGTGSPAAPTTTTDVSGLASVTYTLGRFAGVETVEASVTNPAASPVVFTATATPNGTISGVVSVTSALLEPPPVSGLTAPRMDPVASPVRPSGSKQSALTLPRSGRSGPVVTAAVAEPEYVPDELIVTFKSSPLSAPPMGSMALASSITARRVGTSIRAALAPHVNRTRLEVAGVSPTILSARVKVTDPRALDATAAELRSDPNVATVERNLVVRGHYATPPPRFAAPTLPNDPLYPWQAWHYAMMDLPQAWNITTGSAPVLVAVVDDGINNHPDIRDNLRSDGHDFVSDIPVPVCAGGTISNAGDLDGYDSDPTQPAHYDFSGGCIGALKASGNHGLHTAGTIGAAGNQGIGVSGVNWTVEIRPVRVLGVSGSGTAWDIAQGVLYAAGLPADDGMAGTVQAQPGAKIINMSLGGPTESLTLKDAVIAATNAGALIVASAGNQATSDPNYPAAYPQTFSVSAVGPDRVLASYSSFGSTVDLAAPGGDFSDGDASFGVMSTVWNFVSPIATWDSWQGTSMAAPHVSGVAALLLANEPSLTAADLKARLINFAVDEGATGRDDLYGWGIVNARNSLTQSFEPARQLFAHLIDANSGARLQTVQAQADGSYAFTELDDGDYLVYAGQDEDGDGQTGMPGLRWGAFGGSATPAGVTVAGAGTYPATFTIGFPTEAEPNDVIAAADVLPIGGYVLGTLTSSADADFSLVQIPTAGQYTLETSAVDGACGFALEENTILQLYDADGNPLLQNDDIDAPNLNFCSRITTTLTAGTYYIAVTGFFGLRYQVQARSGA